MKRMSHPNKYSKNIGLVRCRQCGKKKERVPSELDSSGAWVYRHKDGSRWNRLQCNACVKLTSRGRAYSLGINKPRHKLRDYKNAKGYASELLVKRAFRRIGFTVKQAQCHGPDLILSADGQRYTCEVKTATQHKPYNCWYVAPIYKNRRCDDLVAVVLPNKQIYIEAMKDYLLKCAPSGRRSFTRILRPEKKSWVGPAPKH